MNDTRETSESKLFYDLMNYSSALNWHSRLVQVCTKTGRVILLSIYYRPLPLKDKKKVTIYKWIENNKQDFNFT